MATLVLTTVGGLLGPVGAAVGGLIGNAIDREVLFKPKGREGPRLAELGVQTSSYGTQIPRLFGTMRVAGTVIWATDLIEHRATEGGKGRPSVTNYSYTASFAVALSGRRISGVGRIWAEGKLLRGAAGDFKTRTGGFRLYPGGEDQAADPLIVAAEGAGFAPAHRGIAYAVFEDLELADFGNRIPSLTFEVIADPGPVRVGAVIADISGGEIAADGGRMLGGFSAHGASVRAVAETLAGADGAWFACGDAGLVLAGGDGAAEEIVDAGAYADSRRSTGARGRRTIAAADSAPRGLSLAYYDSARDYQIGVQRAGRPGAGWRETRVELAAVLDAGAAKSVAEGALARIEAERERRSVSLGWDALAIPPGGRVTIAGSPGLWRVDRWTLEAMVVTLECIRVAPGSIGADASGGRVLAAPDVATGETIVHAFELPPIDGSLAVAPRLAIAAAGTAPGWRSAALLLSVDGVRWTAAGSTALPAVIGSIAVPPGPAPAGLEDRANAIEVVLAHDGMALGDSDLAGLDSGANLALAGEELIQFARAEPMGANRWRLSGLWRGRRGTEAAAGAQGEGDRFVLIASESLTVIDLPPEILGGSARIMAQGAGDSDAAVAEAVVGGGSIAPPSPAHLSVAESGDGGAAIRWVRRSRIGWRWIDGVDSPLGEESERYRVTISPAGGPERVLETATQEAPLTPEERAPGVTVTVRQAGSHALSPPAVMVLAAI